MCQEASKSRDAEGDTPTPVLSSLFSQYEAFIDYALRKSFFTGESLRGFICPETQQRNARERYKLASEHPGQAGRLVAPW